MILKTLEIRFSLPSTVKLNQAIGSIMQGVLMERIDRDYATYLHKQNLRPYSQCRQQQDGHDGKPCNCRFHTFLFL